VIDEHSHWIDAYFEETKLASIHVGDPVEATLGASRIAVRIRIEQVPPDVPLVAGMTCSVAVVGGKQAPAPKRDQGIFDRLISGLG
jgi:multidrug resistance efflux pump